MDGIFLINKPIGMTSRSVCNRVSKSYQTRKVGHVGTLDPFASGLLIVAMGKCTKAVTFFDEATKEYIATIKLGSETDTLDNTGKVVATKEVGKLSKEEIEKVLDSFKGEIEQVPPMTSAIHVNGKRAYEYAHNGENIELPTRKVTVNDIKLIKYEKGEIVFYSNVSKGTYIRSLGRDIALKLNTVGHLSQLERVGVDVFNIKETASLEDVLNKNVTPLSTYDVLSRFIEVITKEDKEIEDIKNGKIKFLDIKTKSNRILVVDSSRKAIAIYNRNKDNQFEFVRGLF